MTNPKLRFREPEGMVFANWEKTTLGELSMVSNGCSFPVSIQGENTAEVPFHKVSSMNLRGNEKTLISADNYVSSQTITTEGLKPFKAPGIVFAKVGAALLLDRKRIVYPPYLIDNNMMAVTPNEKCDLNFIYTLLCRTRLASLTQVGALPSINTTQVRELEISVPEKREQRRIADFFTTFDEKIALAERKLAALQTLKSGLMQKIFSQEIRFKREDGSDFSIWKKTFLGQVGNLRGRIGFRGYTRADITTKEEGVIALAPGSISDGHVNLEEGTYITHEKYEESPEIKVTKDDILFTKTGSTVGKIGLVDRGDIEATVNPQIALITVNKKQAEAYFVYSYLQSPTAQRYVTAIVVGGAIPTLSQQELKAMPVPLIDHAEQRDIAHLFLHIDKRIRCSKQKLLLLKKMKQAFMQQMFV